MAELLEMPIMLVVAIVAARWTVQRLAVPLTLSTRLGMGLLALILLLIAEFTLIPTQLEFTPLEDFGSLRRTDTLVPAPTPANSLDADPPPSSGNFDVAQQSNFGISHDVFSPVALMLGTGQKFANFSSDYRAIAAVREVTGEKLLEAMGIKSLVAKKRLPTALRPAFVQAFVLDRLPEYATFPHRSTAPTWGGIYDQAENTFSRAHRCAGFT